MIIFEGKSTQNRLQPASSKSPPTGVVRNPLKIEKKSARRWKKLARGQLRAGPEAIQSWPGGGPELAKSWPEPVQKLARNWPKSGQKVIKKWSFWGGGKNGGEKPCFQPNAARSKTIIFRWNKGGVHDFRDFRGIPKIDPKIGPKLAQNWPKAGQKLAKTWPETSQKLARNRPEVGRKRIKTCPEAGQESATNRAKSGQKQVEKVGQKLAKATFLQAGGDLSLIEISLRFYERSTRRGPISEAATEPLVSSRGILCCSAVFCVAGVEASSEIHCWVGPSLDSSGKVLLLVQGASAISKMEKMFSGAGWSVGLVLFWVFSSFVVVFFCARFLPRV